MTIGWYTRDVLDLFPYKLLAVGVKPITDFLSCDLTIIFGRAVVLKQVTECVTEINMPNNDGHTNGIPN